MASLGFLSKCLDSARKFRFSEHRKAESHDLACNFCTGWKWGGTGKALGLTSHSV